MSDTEQQTTTQPVPQPQAAQEAPQPTAQQPSSNIPERTMIVSDAMQVRNAAQRETAVKVDRPQEGK